MSDKRYFKINYINVSDSGINLCRTDRDIYGLVIRPGLASYAPGYQYTNTQIEVRSLLTAQSQIDTDYLNSYTCASISLHNVGKSACRICLQPKSEMYGFAFIGQNDESLCSTYQSAIALRDSLSGPLYWVRPALCQPSAPTTLLSGMCHAY